MSRDRYGNVKMYTSKSIDIFLLQETFNAGPCFPKARDLVVKCSYRFEIWPAHRQQCCRVPVKLQSHRPTLDINLAATRVCEIYDYVIDYETSLLMTDFDEWKSAFDNILQWL